MAAMIVIAAQAQPFGVQGAENALSFSHLNKGLYNRLGTVVVDSATDNNTTTKTNNNSDQRYIELRDFIEKIYDGTGGAKTDEEKKAAAAAATEAENKSSHSATYTESSQGFK